tara:strand:+ start:1185 stop:1907 length:723 start_codon:yes stop_codon:yes gene_type:complete
MKRLRIKPAIYDYCWLLTRPAVQTLRKLDAITDSGPETRILDIGCGEKPFRELFGKSNCYIGVDLRASSQADIYADLNQPLPIKSNSADIIICSEVLEHVENPNQLIKEMSRCLTPNGVIYISCPFAYPIHGQPFDYQRLTSYYFTKTLARCGLKIKELKVSNSLLTTSLFQACLIIEVLPVPRLCKGLVIALINSVSTIVDTLLFAIFREGTAVGEYLCRFPAGYSLLALKNDNNQSRL